MKKRRRWVPGLWIVAILVVAGLVLQYVPSGEVAIMPGVTGNLKQMVKVSQGHSAGPGRLMMVAVDVGVASEFQYLTRMFRPTWEFERESLVFGPLNMKQYVTYNQDLMSQSQEAAEVAGERLAGLNAHVVTVPGALVLGLVKGGPAMGKLEPGDLITKIGSYAITTPTATAIRAVMHHFRVGEMVNVTVQRKGRQVVVPVKAGHIKGDPDPAFGIYVGQLQRAIIPRKVTIHAGRIGGPSAGMMFALEIYDQITGHNLAHGQRVAGTGEILPNGHVEMIGGVAQKVVTVYRAGARVFVVPKGNYPKAEAMAQKMGYKIKIFPVTNIHQALHDIVTATS